MNAGLARWADRTIIACAVFALAAGAVTRAQRLAGFDLAIVDVENYQYATSQLAQTTLRSVLGELDLDELLSARDKLNARLQDIHDRQTDRWGIKV